MTHRTANAQDARAESLALNTQIADAQFLPYFLSLSAAEKASCWRGLSAAEKSRLVCRQIEAAGYDWDDASVAHFIGMYDAKWGSDMDIPAAEAILVVVKERIDEAQLHGDAAGVGQLNRVRINLKRGARLNWTLGDLLIQSVNNPGTVYSVNRAGCSCPNGLAGKAECWHVCLFDILLDMLATEIETADNDADESERAQQLLSERLEATARMVDRMQAAQRLAARICAARANYDYAA